MKSNSTVWLIILLYPLESLAQHEVELQGTTYNMYFQDLIIAQVKSDVLGIDTTLFTPTFSIHVPIKTNFDLHFTAPGMGITIIENISLKQSTNIGNVPLFPHNIIGGEYWISKKKILFGFFKKNIHGFIPQKLYNPISNGTHILLCNPKDSLSNTFLLRKEGHKAYVKFDDICKK